MSVSIHPSWLEVLKPEFDTGYMKELKAFLVHEKENGFEVYPKGGDIFNAFNHTPFDQVKVVLLGQDPYHGKNQAHGLSFSVQKGVTIPPSLRNIYLELTSDIAGFRYPAHGNLTQWADQGVLLLNATLTVRANKPGSHQKKGWELFTDSAIKQISAHRSGVVFLLWGKFAQAKTELIDVNKHHILKAAHPSPYSAANGFFGCRHFSTTNTILLENDKEVINWQIN